MSASAASPVKAETSRAPREGRNTKGKGALAGLSGMKIGLGAAGAALAGSALFNVIRARRAERENPMRGKLMTVDGVELHYVDSATPGPAIVLLHGNAVTLEDWFASGIFQELSKANRVIAFDRPGFGYSSRPRTRLWSLAAQADLLAVAIRSLTGRATLVCHSFGTLVGMEIALKHPGLVSELVLMSGYHYPSLRADVIPASIPAIPIVGDVERYSVGPLLGAALRPAMERAMFAPAKVPASWKRFPFAMTLRPSQMRAVAEEAAMMVPGAARLSSRYSQLSMPVRIVSGEGDKVVDHSGQSERLADALPSAELITLQGVGHMVHHSAKDRVLHAIER